MSQRRPQHSDYEQYSGPSSEVLEADRRGDGGKLVIETLRPWAEGVEDVENSCLLSQRRPVKRPR